MGVTIRNGTADDGATLQAIELLAGERFREIGMADIADSEPFALANLAHYADAGRSWVAVDDAGVLVGYVLVDLVDGEAHIEQISVVPEHQGHGVGRALIEQVRSWAFGQGADAITLTTFRAVPWNAPLYAHLGFVELAPDQIGPEMTQVQITEAELGLDPASRVAMLLDLGPSIVGP